MLKSKLHRELNVNRRTKAEHKISSSIGKLFRRSKIVIPLEDTVGSIIRKLGLRNLNNPFEITLQSWKANVKKVYKFNNLDHYKNWINKIMNSGQYEDYEYKRKYQY
jgi:di/tripeptidase